MVCLLFEGEVAPNYFFNAERFFQANYSDASLSDKVTLQNIVTGIKMYAISTFAYCSYKKKYLVLSL